MPRTPFWRTSLISFSLSVAGIFAVNSCFIFASSSSGVFLPGACLLMSSGRSDNERYMTISPLPSAFKKISCSIVMQPDMIEQPRNIRQSPAMRFRFITPPQARLCQSRCLYHDKQRVTSDQRKEVRSQEPEARMKEEVGAKVPSKFMLTSDYFSRHLSLVTFCWHNFGLQYRASLQEPCL